MNQEEVITSYVEVERMLTRCLQAQCRLLELHKYLYDLTPTISCGTHKLLLDGGVESRIQQALRKLVTLSNIDNTDRFMVYQLVDIDVCDTSVTAYVSFRYAGHTAAAMLKIDMIGKIVPIQDAAFGDAIQFTWLGQE